LRSAPSQGGSFATALQGSALISEAGQSLN
jgi:hypothetical protein